MWTRAVVALCAAAVAVAFTVDCDRKYANCDEQLDKLVSDEDNTRVKPIKKQVAEQEIEPKIKTIATREESMQTTPAAEPKKPRLLEINLDDLQSFANALHNQSNPNRKLPDLSDVSVDSDEEEQPLMSESLVPDTKDTSMPDKFFSSLQGPLVGYTEDPTPNEYNLCKENGVTYKIGDKIDRACEDTCICTSNGFECSPRCKHPYIRRGRQLNDPLCFESPVDECCSILACASGDDGKLMSKGDVCRYDNKTYTYGMTWNVACEKVCACEKDGIISCKPRCPALSASENCINVQDPHDACCEVQVCDVSQDGHEQPPEFAPEKPTQQKPQDPPMTPAIETQPALPVRPLVLAEPIGSVKVLQNNTVQITLSHMNSSDDPIHLLLSSDGGKTFENVDLVYDNMIMNLEGGKNYILKTKETNTKFNFTITATDNTSKDVEMSADLSKLITAETRAENLEPRTKPDKIEPAVKTEPEVAKTPSVKVVDNTTTANNTEDKVGCIQDGVFYKVGEEFHIGCSHLCECTGMGQQDCVLLECPSHVGLELVARGCVRWAPSPPATPPNCCPREARCLSDGSCYFNGVPIPNWSEVPISLSGCERRCFCENGELDCQQICAPLPLLPPPTMRCPQGLRPAPMNISDEDCCQEWACIPKDWSEMEPETTTTENSMTAVLPLETTTINVLPTPMAITEPSYPFMRNFVPQVRLPLYIKSQSLPLITEKALSRNKTYFIDSFNMKVLNQNQPILPLLKSLGEPQFSNFRNGLGESETPALKVADKNVTQIEVKPKYAQVSLDTKMISDPSIVDTNEFSNVNTARSQPSEVYFYPSNQDFISLPPLKIYTHYPESKEDLADSLNKQFQEHFNSIKSKEKDVGTKVLLPNKMPIGNTRIYDIIINNKQVTQDFVDRFQSGQSNNLPNKSQVDRENIKVGPTERPYEYHNLLWDDAVLQKFKKDVTEAFPTNQSDVSNVELEIILKQMDPEVETSHNLGRSLHITKNSRPGPGTPRPPDAPTTKPVPTRQPFIPTIPPDVIHYPSDDDYEQNNVNKPILPSPNIPGLPKIPGSYADDNKKLSVISVQTDSPTSVKMLFGLPPVLVGLRGSVDLRYTDKVDEDISRWSSQVFAPADEVLTTARLEFRLTGLKPSTLYKIRAKLYLHNLPVEPQSDVYTVRTMDLPVEEKQREVDSQLKVVDVNDTVAHLTWRRFNEDELQYIDGIQVRYRPVGTPIYLMTELLHHSRSSVELAELRPQSRYEASLVLVAPPRATVELTDPSNVEFTTQPKIDPYSWSVVAEARAVGAGAVEVRWRGVPAPPERWVRVFRAAHACPPARTETDKFQLAARDQPTTITITGLTPNTRCRVWLELFLTNGKIKTSNVLEVVTKPEDKPEVIDNVIEASSVGAASHRGDYYGALVSVGVIAALGAVTSLLLLLIVLRRHRPRAHNITPVPSAPRESSLPPYDNPAYKLELQQETMDL